MSDTQEVYVLDFVAGTVKYFDVPRHTDSEKIEQYIEDMGMNVSDCEYMVCDSHTPIKEVL